MTDSPGAWIIRGLANCAMAARFLCLQFIQCWIKTPGSNTCLIMRRYWIGLGLFRSPYWTQNPPRTSFFWESLGSKWVRKLPGKASFGIVVLQIPVGDWSGGGILLMSVTQKRWKCWWPLLLTESVASTGEDLSMSQYDPCHLEDGANKGWNLIVWNERSESVNCRRGLSEQGKSRASYCCIGYCERLNWHSEEVPWRWEGVRRYLFCKVKLDDCSAALVHQMMVEGENSVFSMPRSEED